MDNFLIKKSIWLRKITKSCINAGSIKLKIIDIIIIENMHL